MDRQELLDEYGEWAEELIDDYCSGDVDQAERFFDEFYCGKHEDLEDFAEGEIGQSGVYEIDNFIYQYIDWDRLARDLFISDYFYIKEGHYYHVFRNF